MSKVKEVFSVIGKILNSKIVLYGLLVIAGLVAFQMYRCGGNSADERIETYKRQLSGQLTQKEKDLQKANKELGLLKSQLVSQEDLLKQIKYEKEELDEEFEKFKVEYNLTIRSKDKTIARLKQKVSDGNVTVSVDDSDICSSVDGCVIAYMWQDKYGRFRLMDENIFDEQADFEADQVYKVYGEIWEEKDGSLQVRRLVLREVYKDGDKYVDVPGAKAEIIESDFAYHNPPSVDVEWKWQDLFRLRGIILVSSEIMPEPGDLRLGLGLSFFDWEGLAINSHTSFDFDDARNISQHIGVSYTPRFFNLDLNFALGASIGTPFYNPFNEYSFKIDLLFYLNN